MYEHTVDDLPADRLARKLAAAAGVVFLLVGIAGFIPGLTTNFDEMEFAGHESGAELFGLFQVSVLHNLVHLAFGVVGLLLATRAAAARSFLIGGGVVYLALWLYGVVVDETGDANFVPLNDADDWLHLGLGVGMLALGLATLPRDRGAREVDSYRRPGTAQT
jgi:hypothetical protein